MKDPNGTVHEPERLAGAEIDSEYAEPIGRRRRKAASSQYDHDEMGRQTQDCPSAERNDLERGCATLRKVLSAIAPCQWITSFASGVDDAVKRIATQYDNRGLTEKVTSYDNATVGSGTVGNEVVYEYDDFGQLKEDSQSHSGAMTGATPKVSYGHENGSSGSTARRKSMACPDGRTKERGGCDPLYGWSHLGQKQFATEATFAEYSYLRPAWP